MELSYPFITLFINVGIHLIYKMEYSLYQQLF
jgi:hypothetical protein